MRKLGVFLSISLDGYFADSSSDMSWAHDRDPEFNTFLADNASSGSELVMGRRTYDLMSAYWPTDFARQNDPALAAAMNSLPKIVFSRTMREASWNNTRLVKTDPIEALRALKREEGRDMVVLGSGSIVGLLAQAGLVDTFQFVIVPLALGAGRSVFAGMCERLRLEPIESRTFKNGNVALTYVPVTGVNGSPAG
jgi:dihydrofolate reductase